MAKTDQRARWICLLLGLVTLACYWPVTGHGFVNIDDYLYIFENDHVKSGLSWNNIVWAFTTDQASNRHPLTWISLMVDCQLFGANPRPIHLVDVGFHIADTLLLFLLLRQLTGFLWRSAFVAAFFAWHPLHVESVAWASERKDVLSTLFWLLAMMAYVRYADQLQIKNPTPINRERAPINRERKCKIWYWLALVFFACGLMSKPMVVTLPCVLLLLDFWPLGRTVDVESKMEDGDQNLNIEHRTSNAEHREVGGRRTEAVRLSTINSHRSTARSLLVEKIPFFALTLLACAVTVMAQRSAMKSLEVLPLTTRIANAVVSYVTYVARAFWPVNLAAMYPYSKHLSPFLVLGAVVALTGVTAVCVMKAKRRPYLFTGWLWFLGTLVPTIGLVQVGDQSMADRYMYIPSVGLFIAVTWLLADWAGSSPAKRTGLAGLGVAALAGCLVLTSAQLKTWEDGETLFRHAIAVTKDNYIACDSLAGALDAEGRHQEALDYYYEAVRIEPGYPQAQYNLGTLLMEMGRLDEAVEHLQAAIAANPNFAAAYVNLGSAFMKQRRPDEAVGQFARALQLDTSNPEAFFNMGTWLLSQSRLEDAATEFAEAVRLKPDYEDAHGNLGVTLLRLGRAEEGTAQLEAAVRLAPTNSQTHFNLGLAFLTQNEMDESVAQFSEALRLRPDQPMILSKLALALAKSHKAADAVARYREALQVQPENLDALNGLVWLLATCPDPKIRSGTEAVELATKACDLTEDRRPETIETLAAAYAEAGRFPEAITTVQKAIDMASAAGRDDLAAKEEELLKLFQAGRAYRDAQ